MKLLLLLLTAIAGLQSVLLAQDQAVFDDALENGWQSYGWATLNFANASPVHGGTQSISVVDSTNNDGALYLHHGAFDPSLYQNLRFWIYPTKTGSGEMKVQATLSTVPQPAVMLSFSASQVNAWQQITIPLASLAAANNASFDGFWIQNATGAPLTFYVDDISLTAAPAPAQIQLTVNTQSAVRTIDGRIYGVNIAIWDGSLSSAASGTLLDTMNTQSFRFPGGSASDDYDWHTGRTISTGAGWPNNAPTFAKVAAARSAQGYVTVNYGSGTPEQAAAWVAYYNASPSSAVAIGVDSKGTDWKTAGYWAAYRAAAPISPDDGFNFLRTARSAPFGVRYWEVGNECYGGWETDQHGVSGSGLTGSAHDPYTYAQAFQHYVQKMSAMDPTIRIGAVSTPGEDSYGIGTHPAANPNERNTLHTGWTAVLLATLKSEGVTPGFLIHHSYPQDAGSESDSTLLRSGATLISDAANLREMITDYFGATSGTAIELDVTELNSVSSTPGKQIVSLVDGLFMADAIGNLAQTEFNSCVWWDFRNGSETDGNNSASLYGWRPFGDYGVVASGDRSDTAINTPYPAFYSAKLLNFWGRGGDRTVSASSNYALLSAYAAKLANGNIALLVVNKHPSNDLTAQIALNGFTPGSTAGVVYSYGKQNDLSNADLTQGAFNASNGTFTYVFPSYSMSVLIVKGQFEAWREQNFAGAELMDLAFSGDGADPDHDGISNLAEYALGLNPNSPSVAGGPVIGTQVVSGKSYLTLTFTQQASLTDVIYTVEVSGDLQTWQSGPSYAVRTDAGTTNQATYQDLTPIQGSAHRFIRLRVTRP